MPSGPPPSAPGRDPQRGPPRGLWLPLLLLLPLVGCSLFYRNSLDYEDFSLHGDEDEAVLREKGETVQAVFDAYRVLFPSFEEKVRGARVLYEEDALSRQRIYTSDLRREGYYLPMLDLVHLSPRRPRGDIDDRTVILHEVAHHFLISAYPQTSSQYWLNEGFACALEVSFFDEDGTLRTPLFHPELFSQASRVLRERGEEAFRAELTDLLGASWFRFHHSEGKERHYAYSWSLFWHLVREESGSLEERLLRVMAIEPSTLPARIDGVIEDLRRGHDPYLEELLGDPALRGWCFDRWTELPYADARRFLSPLLSDLDAGVDDVDNWGRLTRLVNGRVRGVGSRTRRNLHGRIASTLEDREVPTAVRLSIAEGLAESGARSWTYIRPLIDGLEAEDGDLRAACAAALAGLSRRKPTVINPSFWRDAPVEARQSEVEEWRRWWDDRTGSRRG